MNGDITGLCREHSFESAADLCRICGAEYCADCLVHPFGKPLCKSCAIAAGGVRNGGTKKPIKKNVLRRRLKEFERVRELKEQQPAHSPIFEPIVGSTGSVDAVPDEAIEQADSAREPDDGPPRPGSSTTERSEPTDPDLVAEAAARLAPAPVGTIGAPPEGAVARPASPGATHPIDWSNPFG